MTATVARTRFVELEDRLFRAPMRPISADAHEDIDDVGPRCARTYTFCKRLGVSSFALPPRCSARQLPTSHASRAVRARLTLSAAPPAPGRHCRSHSLPVGLRHSDVVVVAYKEAEIDAAIARLRSDGHALVGLDCESRPTFVKGQARPLPACANPPAIPAATPA